MRSFRAPDYSTSARMGRSVFLAGWWFEADLREEPGRRAALAGEGCAVVEDVPAVA